MRSTAAGGPTVETHNLKHGFKEVVVPFGSTIEIVFLPDAATTQPYDGHLTASWEIVGVAGARMTGESGPNAASLRRWTNNPRSLNFAPGALPDSKQHEIVATWDPDSGDPCTREKEFTLTFAARTAPPPPLNLVGFVGEAFPGTGTRVRTGDPRLVPGPTVNVPIAIHWDVAANCCDVTNGKRKVIQFARAVIKGPNGWQGKDWSLDISDAERRDKPDHDPSYGASPGNDGADNPNQGGGTGPVDGGLRQWDAPGMPKTLYDRLAGATTEPSEFVQQFIALLVCRGGSGGGIHKAGYYLANAKVKAMMIVTMRWRFPGNGAPPQITTTNHVMDGGCEGLAAVLAANGLTNAFSNPQESSREIRLLTEDEHRQLGTSVEQWESDPEANLHRPVH